MTLVVHSSKMSKNQHTTENQSPRCGLQRLSQLCPITSPCPSLFSSPTPLLLRGAYEVVDRFFSTCCWSNLFTGNSSKLKLLFRVRESCACLCFPTNGLSVGPREPFRGCCFSKTLQGRLEEVPANTTAVVLYHIPPSSGIHGGKPNNAFYGSTPRL